jgi:hypothetical protein
VTWHDCKLVALQRLFAIDGTDIETSDNTSSYLAAMPGAANEGMLLLATSGRPIRKSLTIAQYEAGSSEPTADVVRVCGNTVERYMLGAIKTDFYSLGSENRITYETGEAYGDFLEYALEGDDVLVLPGDFAGTVSVWYDAYPEAITSATAEDYVLPLAQEAAALLPLYIASELYKDDDIGVATQYRNEFEAGREALLARPRRSQFGGGGSFKSVKGWC